jgi:hypothetical protein
MPIPLCLSLSVSLLLADPGPSPPDTLFDLGRFHGVQDAQEAPTRGDFARGFGWGLVAGPLGAVVAVRRASLSIHSRHNSAVPQKSSRNDSPFRWRKRRKVRPKNSTSKSTDCTLS